MNPPGPNRPRLLAPAGGQEQLETAILYGADAAYLSGPDLSLRAGGGGFAGEALREACRRIPVHYCLNLLAQDRHLPLVRARLEELAALPADARPAGLVVADPGVLRMARRLAPDLPVHVSTQANTTNRETLALWKDLGASRVILARELDGPGMAAMVRAGHALGMEMECFVHGAQCLAVSGRCLLSMALNRRHANEGRCTHPCRFEYRTIMVEDKTRPGEGMWEVADAAEHGEHGEYPVHGEGHAAFFACEDLCLLPALPWLASVGMDWLKLEGRMRGGGALAPVVDAYASALRGLAAGEVPGGTHLRELRQASSRPLGTGFWLGEAMRRWPPLPETARRPVLGRLESVGAPGEGGEGGLVVAVRGRWDATRPIQWLMPGLRRPRVARYVVEDGQGRRLDTAHSGQRVRLMLEEEGPALVKGLYFRQDDVT